MLPLPDVGFDPEEADELADWVELSALAEDGVLFSDFHDELSRALAGAAGGRRRPHRPSREEETGEDDPVGTAFDSTRQIIRTRHAALGTGYPFDSGKSELSVHGGRGWESHIAYTSLALADLGRKYSRFRMGNKFPTLFEFIVAASLRCRLGGATVRFGSPRYTTDVPGAVGKRIDWLSRAMGASINEAHRVTKHSVGDEGLDVASRLSFGDEDPGSVVVLAQCATGKSVKKSKKGEPSIKKWEAFLDWNAYLVKAVAVPYRLDPPRTLRAGELFREFEGAVILDRPRLCQDRVDRELGERPLRELKRWCKRGLNIIERT